MSNNQYRSTCMCLVTFIWHCNVRPDQHSWMTPKCQMTLKMSHDSQNVTWFSKWQILNLLINMCLVACTSIWHCNVRQYQHSWITPKCHMILKRSHDTWINIWLTGSRHIFDITCKITINVSLIYQMNSDVANLH